jgi:Tfp pilus assembly protein PilV
MTRRSTPKLPQCVNELRSPAGFALLEFLVAFNVLAAFLAAVLAAVSIALRGDRGATFQSIAVLQAVSRINALGVEGSSALRMRSGTFENGNAWQIAVQPYGRVQIGPNQATDAVWVEVVVSDPSASGQRFVRLRTLEILAGVQ